MSAYRDRFTGAVLKMFGADVIVRGHTEVPEGALIVANHRSALDICAALFLFRTVLVSRHDVAEWPVMGRMARHGGTIFVNREDRQSGAAAVRAIRRELKAGQRVMVFPEGTTHGEDNVREFQPGAFAASAGLDVPIVPVGFAYQPETPFDGGSFGRHLLNLAATRHTRVVVNIGSPLRSGLKAREAAAVARDHVQELVSEAKRGFVESGG